MAVDERKGATVSVPLLAVERAGVEYAEFADEVADLCGFIVAGGGWWRQTQVPMSGTVTCVGPASTVDELVDLVAAFNARWAS